MKSDLFDQPVAAEMKPLYRYMGGKRKMLKHYRDLYPKDFQLYVEPFFGGGAVYCDLRNRGYRGPAVINDFRVEIKKFLEAIREDYIKFYDAIAREVDDLLAVPAIRSERCIIFYKKTKRAKC